MQVVNLIQGTPEWHAHRRNHFNASDAPAMIGESPYKTRDKLLYELFTGIVQEPDAQTQKRFDDGHKFEALARPLAEKILGQELSPTVGVEGKYSASFDGITFDDDVIYEHKTLNATLRDLMASGEEAPSIVLPIIYPIQMEHQLLVSKAKKVLFIASEWKKENHPTEHFVLVDHKGKLSASGTPEYYSLVDMRYSFYEPNLELREKIIAGWAQFEADLANYVPPVQVEKVVAETVEALPVPSVVVRGEITQSNIAEITPKFDAYLESIKTELSTDQDFADAEANAKNCREMGKRIEALQDNIIAQMVSVNEVNSILSNYKEAFNKVGLRLEKAVKEQKESIKTQAIMSAKAEYEKYVSALNEGLPVLLSRELQCPNFAEAIKGVKTIESMQSRINDALAKGKVDASAYAVNLKAKVAYVNEATQGYEHLFKVIDLVFKDLDYIKLHIQTVKEAEDKRKAEHEAAIKAKAEAEARAKVEAEQKQIKEAKPQVSESEAVTLSSQDQVAQSQSSLTKQTEQAFTQQFEGTKTAPSRSEIVEMVMDKYGVTYKQAETWLVDMFYALAA